MATLATILAGKKAVARRLFGARVAELALPAEMSEAERKAFLAGFRKGWNGGFLDGADIGAQIGMEMVGGPPTADASQPDPSSWPERCCEEAGQP